MEDKKRSNAPYDPTPEEIAEATRQIRESWDESTELKRRCFQNREPEVPIVKSGKHFTSETSEFACYYGTGAQ